jgi:putative oxidoreductase
MPIHHGTAERVSWDLPRPGFALVGRILLATIFMISGIAKLTNTAATASHMQSVGIPAADILAIVAGVAEVLGAAALAAGMFTRLGALGLVLFMIPTTLLFHNFWAFEGEEQKQQMIEFLKNLAIIGGLCTVIANGAGRFSLDAKLHRHQALR